MEKFAGLIYAVTKDAVTDRRLTSDGSWSLYIFSRERDGVFACDENIFLPMFGKVGKAMDDIYLDIYLDNGRCFMCM